MLVIVVEPPVDVSVTVCVPAGGALDPDEPPHPAVTSAKAAIIRTTHVEHWRRGRISGSNKSPFKEIKTE